FGEYDVNLHYIWLFRPFLLEYDVFLHSITYPSCPIPIVGSFMIGDPLFIDRFHRAIPVPQTVHGLAQAPETEHGVVLTSPKRETGRERGEIPAPQTAPQTEHRDVPAPQTMRWEVPVSKYPN